MTSRNFNNFFEALKSHMTTLASNSAPSGAKKDLKEKFSKKWDEQVEELKDLIFSKMPVISASGAMEGVIRLPNVDAEGNDVRKPLTARVVFQAVLANDKKAPLRTPLALSDAQKKANQTKSSDEKKAEKKDAMEKYTKEVNKRFKKLNETEVNTYKAMGLFISEQDQEELYGFQPRAKGAKGEPKLNSLTAAWPSILAAWKGLGSEAQAEYVERVTAKGKKAKAPKRNINVILSIPRIREQLWAKRANAERKTGGSDKRDKGDMNLTALTLFKQLMREDGDEPMEYDAERAGISEASWNALRKAVSKADGDKHNKKVLAVWAHVTTAKPTGIYKGIKGQLEAKAVALRTAYRSANEDFVAEIEEEQKAKKAKKKAENDAKKGKTTKGKSSKPSSKAGSKTSSKVATPAASDDEAEEQAEEATPAPKKSSKAKKAQEDATPAPKTKVSKSKGKKVPEPEPEPEEDNQAEPDEEMPETQAFEDVPVSDAEVENEEPTPAPTKKDKKSKDKKNKSKAEDAPAKSSKKGKAVLTQQDEDAVMEDEVEAADE